MKISSKYRICCLMQKINVSRHLACYFFFLVKTKKKTLCFSGVKSLILVWFTEMFMIPNLFC